MRYFMNDWKKKFADFWQGLKNKNGSKNSSRSSKSAERYNWKDYGLVFLRTLKLLVDFAYLILALISLLGAGIGAGYLASQVDTVDVPETKELTAKVSDLSKISQLTYADGKLISKIDTDLLRTPVESSAISDNIKNAIVATEDENFKSHKGVVPKAIFRATLGSVLGIGESSGGSTLTQQLIKQQILGDDPTFKRKATEILYALELERNMDKDTILTNYLNVSPFGRNHKGQNIAGIEEAAQGIFGVSAKDLTIPQAAFLAGLPQSPIVYSPYLPTGAFKTDEDMTLGLTRQKNVLYNMYRAGMLTKEDYESYLAYDLKQDFRQPEARTTDSHDYLYYAVLEEAQEIMYQYLIKRDKVSEQELKNDATKETYRELAYQELSQGGYTVKSTIKPNIYKAMQDTVANYGHLLDDGTGEVQVGNVLLDNSTGAILGFVGGRNYNTNQNNHALNSLRSPGSSIKPILPYAIAIDRGLMGSASIVSNYPTTYSSGQRIYHVGDAGTKMITLQEALNISWNIPAFWTYKMLRDKGVDVESYMTKMGYDIQEYGIESLPLGGGVEVSVLQQANAYQTLANGGAYLKHYIVESVTASDGTVIFKHEKKPVQVFSKATASIMMHLLRGPLTSGYTTRYLSALRGVNGNLANADWAGKTGTTDDYTDSWLVVTTPGASLGSWIGHDDNTPLAAGTGVTNMASYLAQLTNAIHAADSSVFATNKRFELDSSVIGSTVLASTGLRPGTVLVNGKSITVGGATTTSYWAKNGAPSMTYRFAIGGTNADYTNAWGAFMPNDSNKNKQESRTDEKDKDRDKKEDTKTDDKESSESSDAESDSSE
uniref:penicillin-binding protein PBP1B n=1 Tax=Streptococcus hillyeri TaxID=2282420 RepID=UPI003F6E0FE9